MYLLKKGSNHLKKTYVTRNDACKHRHIHSSAFNFFLFIGILVNHMFEVVNLSSKFEVKGLQDLTADNYGTAWTHDANVSNNEHI
jgi:hypothetical protein